MKVRMIGACGSGKSTAAKELSRLYQIPFFEMDNVVWDRSEPNQRYPEEIRNANLRKILDLDSWILEGVHLSWTQESFEAADLIFFTESTCID